MPVIYRGGNAGYQSIRRAIFSIAVMTAAIRQWYRLAAAIIIANTALILRFIFAHNRNCRHLFYRTARRAHGAVSIAAAMRYQSTQYAARQCKLSIYPARHLFYRGNDGGNVVIYRRHLLTMPSHLTAVFCRAAARQLQHFADFCFCDCFCTFVSSFFVFGLLCRAIDSCTFVFRFQFITDNLILFGFFGVQCSYGNFI